MSVEVARALHDHHGADPVHQSYPPGLHAGEAPPRRASPLWWSAWQRLGWVAAMVAGLWLVIAWAVL